MYVSFVGSTFNFVTAQTDSDLSLSKMIFKLVICNGKLTIVKNVVRKVYSTLIECVFALLDSADYKEL